MSLHDVVKDGFKEEEKKFKVFEVEYRFEVKLFLCKLIFIKEQFLNYFDIQTTAMPFSKKK